ncbi:MAG TPA: sodium:proton exchanger [Acidimicrobiia bacterium]|nr:sodium:proton exchanger [Acidimicrobiia bacterium]
MPAPAGDGPPRGRRPGIAIGSAVALAVPGTLLHLSGTHPDALVAAVVFGVAIVGAAFMLAWAAEAAQLDISAGLALALLALVAVLPEYAVDFVFTWKAGKDPATYAPDALANMTGGNQLLIGAGWSIVVLLAAYRLRRRRRRDVDPGPIASTEVALHRNHSVELAFLTLATLYGLTLPLHRTLGLFDAVILVTLFVAYLTRVFRAPSEEPDLVGPAASIGALPAPKRRAAVAALFVGAIVVVLACAEPFAQSLVDTGRKFNIDDFLLISLVAPLASEAPELLVAGMFAWRLNTNAGLGALVSSKVNQWTLLVGTLPIVFAISSGGLHGLPIDAVQREELFVTAAQSAYAVAVLANLRISVREAVTMLGLFLVQLVTKFPMFESIHTEARISVGCVYLVLAAGIIFRQRRSVGPLLRDGLRSSYSELGAHH